jgi:oxygen-independent coproporphyrinogen III oxidase
MGAHQKMSGAQSTKRIGPSSIPKNLLDKYYKSGPRYTSYPTAPQFKGGFDETTVVAEWQKTNAPGGRGLSLYLHIPFCEKRCLYCGCYTESGHSQEDARQYLGAAQKEIGRVVKIIDRSRRVEQLALGGGTPTFLNPELMRALVASLQKNFEFDQAGERSIEIDPRSVDNGYLDALSGLGFNRFSFGVQDLDPEVQKKVGRMHSEEKLAGLVDHLRGLGHNAVNIDLIYGLPGQTPQSFSKTIDRVCAIKPTRIALFGYAHVPWVSPHQKALESFQIPVPEERVAIFGLAYEQLLNAGYWHVGMDHFAQPADELIGALNKRTLTRNFMGYTTRRGLDLIGIGASAISSVGACYTQNVKDVKQYIDRAGQSAWVKALVLTGEDELRRELIIDLFCNFFLDMRRLETKFKINFKEHFGEELAELGNMEQDGLVKLNEKSIEVTELGRFFIRNICMTFDQYLGDATGAQYSKTL